MLWFVRKPKPGDLVVVYWRDAWSVDPWTSLHELRQTSDPAVVSVGVFGGLNRDGSWILMSGVIPDDDVGACNWMIPGQMVTEWRRLRPSKAGGRRE